MSDPGKSVFISYRRRLSPFVARSIFGDLQNHGYDVFMDVESIDSGNFQPVILHQIAARPHFLVILIPGSLQLTSEPSDWLRREVEHAIKLQRNIVPVMVEGFDFGTEAEYFPQGRFPGRIEELRGFNGIDVPHNYFNEAMRKLRDRFLKKPTTLAITPAPVSDLAEVKRKIQKSLDLVPNESFLRSFKANLGSPLKFDSWLKPPSVAVKNEYGCLYVRWTTVTGATSYVLEGTPDLLPQKFVKLYKGEKTELPEFSLFLAPYFRDYKEPPKAFRVKAENESLNLESVWSDVVLTPERLPLRPFTFRPET